MVRVLFICHGNICRSPMAEFVMKKLVSDAGLSDKIYIESAATSSEEEGNPVYPLAREQLNAHGISCAGKRAYRFQESDYPKFDYIIAMEKYNLKCMSRRLGKYAGDPDGKISLLLDYTDHPGDISDPWYNGLFAEVYEEIEEGCRGLLNYLLER